MSVVAVARSLAASSQPNHSERPDGLVHSGHVHEGDDSRCLHASRAHHEIDIFSGPAAPTSKSLMVQRDDVVRGEADAIRSSKSQHEKEMRAACMIQAMVRQFLCRRQYARYMCFVKRDLRVLAERRRSIAVVVMQRIVRGFISRQRYMKQRNLDEEKRRDEAAKSKGKKKSGGGGKKAAAPAAPPPPVDYATVPLPTPEAMQLWREAALERNQTFVSAVRQLLDEHFDDAMAAVELYLKGCSNNCPAEPVFIALQVSIQRRKNVSLGLPPNATPAPTAAAGGAGGAKKKK